MKDSEISSCVKKPTKLRNHIYKTETFDSLHLKNIDVSTVLYTLQVIVI